MATPCCMQASKSPITTPPQLTPNWLLLIVCTILKIRNWIWFHLICLYKLVVLTPKGPILVLVWDNWKFGHVPMMSIFIVIFLKHFFEVRECTTLGGYNFFFHHIYKKKICCHKHFFSNHPGSYKDTKKNFQKLLIFFSLQIRSISLGEAFIHSMLICEVNNIRNFGRLWHLLENNIWSLFLNSIITFSKCKSWHWLNFLLRHCHY
jgi:hypothetical protein